MHWNSIKWNDCFALVKFAGLVFLIGYNIVSGTENLTQTSLYALAGAMFLVFAIIAEWKCKLLIIILEGILALIAVFLFPVTGNFFAVIWLLDLITFMQLSAPYYLLGYTGMFLCARTNDSLSLCFGIITFLIVLYIQEKIIIHGYVNILEKSEITEGRLKKHMEKEKQDHSAALRKSRLQSENQLLDERNRIAQAMHDKLGHSINGSLYQLEAAKLLIEKKPKDCQTILQNVIDQLRVSMDEIRIILRREKPDKNRMALLSLQTLCDECLERYQINANLSLEGETDRIGNDTWEIILDNTYEAVTNALKYAKCTKINIDIAVLNQVVRCCISDDGKGIDTFTEGMGIAGMRKRVRDVHGVFDIETEVGFRINMILPTERRG